MKNELSVLKLTLHGSLVGYLTSNQNSRITFMFADEFRNNASRPTLSLITHPVFPHATRLMSEPWKRDQRLPPTFSNLLPEGSLRAMISQGLKVHVDDEFQLISYLGSDLPGALVAQTLEPEHVPDFVLSENDNAVAVLGKRAARENKFSLAGVQMKFSMQEKEGRYNLSKGDTLGDWLIKTPSTQHKDVPANEYTAMTLASLVGVDIPEIKLVDLNKLDNLPNISLPDERLAFAIKRFDRNNDDRVHMEDFAQVLVKYPHDKYNSANYEQIGRILYTYSGDGLADVQQFARRLLVNVLIANGDAHLKNWSLLYDDQITPRLSPAYDILTTSTYIDDEYQFALKLGKTKAWYEVSYETFKYWAERSNIPWRVIKPHLDDAMDKARQLWPDALETLPMIDEHKAHLKQHWLRLHRDFTL